MEYLGPELTSLPPIPWPRRLQLHLCNPDSPFLKDRPISCRYRDLPCILPSFSIVSCHGSQDSLHPLSQTAALTAIYPSLWPTILQGVPCSQNAGTPPSCGYLYYRLLRTFVAKRGSSDSPAQWYHQGGHQAP